MKMSEIQGKTFRSLLLQGGRSMKRHRLVFPYTHLFSALSAIPCFLLALLH